MKDTNKILIVRRRGTSWATLVKQHAKKLLQQERKHKLAILRIQQATKAKALTKADHKRNTLQTDMHKFRSKQRYYMYKGTLYAKVAGKIPTRHKAKLLSSDNTLIAK